MNLNTFLRPSQRASEPPADPQTRLDACLKKYLEYRFISKTDTLWLILIAQAAINARNGATVEEVYNALESK